MLISDWSSDVCSSDLHGRPGGKRLIGEMPPDVLVEHQEFPCRRAPPVHGLDERLADDHVQRLKEGEDSFLPDRIGEHAGNALDGFGHTVCMQGRIHRMAGEGRVDRRRHRLEIAALADQDAVRVLARSEEQTFVYQSLLRTSYAV